MSKYWANGSTRAWRKVRATVLERDKYRCQLMIKDICRTRADCVHHLLGKKLGDDPAQLVASCTPCNLAIGDPTAHDPDHHPRTMW